MEVDVARKRVGLSMRMSDKAEERAEARQQPRQARTEKPTSNNKRNTAPAKGKKQESAGTFADLFANAKQLRK